MRSVARVWTFAIAGLSLAAALRAQQPTPATPPPAEQGKPSPQAKPAPAVQRAPRTAADTARALREPLDTIRLDAQPAGKAPDNIAVDPGPPWRTSYFPYLTSSGGDIMVAARVRPWLPAFEDREPYRAALDLDAGVGIHGSWFGSARFDAPLLWPSWRLVVNASAARQNRLGFYGFGNNTLYDKSLADSTQPNLFRVRRTRYLGFVDLSRRIIGSLYVAGRGAIDRAAFDALDGPSVFQQGYGSEVAETDVNGRIALVYDSRNNEYNTRSGLLWEAGFQAGSGGDGYTRLYSVARAYVPLRGSTVLAGRVGFSDLSGTPDFNARFEIPTWESPTSVYGGYSSNRGYVGGRFVGMGVVFGSIELRQDFLPIGEIAAGTLVAFLDAGRVFENQDFAFTASQLHVSAGIGIAARLLRSTIFTLNLARGGEGWHVSAGSGWAF